MVFPGFLRGLPGTSTRNHPHDPTTSKPVVPRGFYLAKSSVTSASSSGDRLLRATMRGKVGGRRKVDGDGDGDGDGRRLQEVAHG
jgi:hypothetical protein